jgi:phosphoribosylaminoimidazole-succinocarboxamide synthase
MDNLSSVYETHLKKLPLVQKGKVRDIYAIDADHLLIITTDRLSAFDVILPDPVPNKGRILTEISNFWFQKTEHLISNHLVKADLSEILADEPGKDDLIKRSIVVKKLKPLPIEAVVRGYLIGSGWKDYLVTGSVCGIPLAKNLRLAEKLPEAIFTPSTKAAVGDHDENISFKETCNILGRERAEEVRDVTLKIYSQASDFALQRGIIIADTKLEFGLDENENMVVIDELLTPDSSRFWPASSYEVGTSPPSFDKQFVRDYLETVDWNKAPPGPRVPSEILRRTSDKYQEALDIITKSSD